MKSAISKFLAATALIASPAFNLAQAQIAPTAPSADMYEGKPRLIVLSDIGNEPDDQMSFVRLLLYSNEIDIEGLIASTSTWQRHKTNPQTMKEIIADYALVRPNLLLHAQGWPEASALDGLVHSGQPGYGMGSVGDGQSSEGARAIIRAVDRPDPRPVWISVWGGSNTLAQALRDVRATRSPEEVAKFVAKMRVYSISDQDDAGWWIRKEFSSLQYVVTPSTDNGEEYRNATWTGISGDVYYRNGAGADFTTVTNEWLDSNIRAKGPLGRHYPRFMFIMEGDTPAFLGLTANGLESFRSPSWGGWGGRYLFRRPHGETSAMWTQGGDLFTRITSQDNVTGVDGRIYSSDQATIWRWRTAFQNDFSARMDWTIQPYSRANHQPRVVVNGLAGTQVTFLNAEVGKPFKVTAIGTSDPDGNKLTYRWMAYPEAGYSSGVQMGDVELSGAHSQVVSINPKSICRAQWLPSDAKCTGTGIVHLILAVTDNGHPALTSYRRIVLTVR